MYIASYSRLVHVYMLQFSDELPAKPGPPVTTIIPESPAPASPVNMDVAVSRSFPQENRSMPSRKRRVYLLYERLLQSHLNN